MKTLALLLLVLAPTIARAYDRIVVVTVGINDYGGEFAKLANAEADVNEFEEAITTGGWQGQVIPHRLRGAQATKDAILDIILEAGDEAKKGQSLLIFYFAGHGRSTGRIDPQGYLVPYGARRDRSSSWLSMAELQSKLKEDQTENVRHVLVVLASCRGGLFLDETRGNAPTGHLGAAAVKAELARKARVVITAGTRDQDIPDGCDPKVRECIGGKGSVFGRALGDAIKNGSKSAGPDGCLSHSELIAWLESSGRSNQNMPRLGVLDQHEQGIILLCLPGAPFGRDVEAGGARRGGVAPVTEAPPRQVERAPTPIDPAPVTEAPPRMVEQDPPAPVTEAPPPPINEWRVTSVETGVMPDDRYLTATSRLSKEDALEDLQRVVEAHLRQFCVTFTADRWCGPECVKNTRVRGKPLPIDSDWLRSFLPKPHGAFCLEREEGWSCRVKVQPYWEMAGMAPTCEVTVEGRVAQ